MKAAFFMDIMQVLFIYRTQHFLHKGICRILFGHSLIDHFLNLQSTTNITDQFSYHIHFLIGHRAMVTERFEHFKSILKFFLIIVLLQVSNYW